MDVETMLINIEFQFADIWACDQIVGQVYYNFWLVAVEDAIADVGVCCLAYSFQDDRKNNYFYWFVCRVLFEYLHQGIVRAQIGRDLPQNCLKNSRHRLLQDQLAAIASLIEGVMWVVCGTPETNSVEWVTDDSQRCVIAPVSTHHIGSLVMEACAPE